MSLPIETETTETPYLIVGAGLAGCLLAWRLQRRGEDFILIGSRDMPSAFSVAAGVINPVTGRWMTKTWNADTLLPMAQKTYTEIEQAIGIQVFYPLDEIRFCQNEEDVKRVGRRMRNPRYSDVLGEFYAAGQATEDFVDSNGSFEIKQAAYVDLPKLIDALRHHFEETDRFLDECFAHDKLTKQGDGWHYQGIETERVIFCEGAATRSNPWFDNLALNPVKGETLLCKSPTLNLPNTLFHHKKWFLPYPDGSFRIGATYDESDLSPEPTQAKANELLGDAQSALRHPHEIEVQAHLAGVRPSTVDSRPIIGEHPKERGLYVLNGLGSKGASTGPAMAQALCDHLTEGAPIDPEVCISRF